MGLSRRRRKKRAKKSFIWRKKRVRAPKKGNVRALSVFFFLLLPFPFLDGTGRRHRTPTWKLGEGSSAAQMTVGEAYAVGGKIGKHANGVLRGDPPFGREARKTFARIAGGRGRRKGGGMWSCATGRCRCGCGCCCPSVFSKLWGAASFDLPTEAGSFAGKIALSTVSNRSSPRAAVKWGRLLFGGGRRLKPAAPFQSLSKREGEEVHR